MAVKSDYASNKMSRYFINTPSKGSEDKEDSLKFNRTKKRNYHHNDDDLMSHEEVEKKLKEAYPNSKLEETDPFVGPAFVDKAQKKKYLRGKHEGVSSVEDIKLKSHLKSVLNEDHNAARQAARYELLLTEEPGFIETEDNEESWKISQNEISEVSDIATANKKFELHLDQFGPYRIDYTTNGRHLLLGGHMGHIAAFDWTSKDLMCEINVMESLNDIKWLHTENLFAVAQKKWVYIYDNQGIEIHCLKMLNNVLRLGFLPYHFLLVNSNASGFLDFLDVSMGKIISSIRTGKGRLDVLTHNPSNGVTLLGHHSGTVTMYAPNQPEPLATILCHKSPVRAIAVEREGNYMATSGQDRRIRIFDLRTYKPLYAYKVRGGASNLDFSQRGLLAATCQEVVEVYKDPCVQMQEQPYIAHNLQQVAQDAMFCPYEDILGVGCANGFTSMLVPGAGEPNYDAFECNPYRSKKQRQEWEVKALLEKVPSDLISLDPSLLSKIDYVTAERLQKDREERLGYKPQPKKFVPRAKQKGKGRAANVERRKAIVYGAEERRKLKEAKCGELEVKIQEKKNNTKKARINGKEIVAKKKTIKKNVTNKETAITRNSVASDTPDTPKTDVSVKSVLDRFLKTSQ